MSLCVFAIVLTAMEWGPADPPRSLPITFTTSDGVVIGADYYAPKVEKGKKAPAAILIHMYAEDRKSWGPLLGPLHDAGFAVLTYDSRGRGESVKPESMDLHNRYGKLDPTLWVDSWRDVEAAKKTLASTPDCDVDRLVLIAASEGSSIAFDFARRDKNVKAIVGLSPKLLFKGLDSKAHIKECGRCAVKLIAPEKEFKWTEELAAASGGSATAQQFPGGRPYHGSNLLYTDFADEVKKAIVDFVREAVQPGSAEKAKGKPDEKKGK
jgi:pimeloyl-ACP methyl ester carboxylesterase